MANSIYNQLNNNNNIGNFQNPQVLMNNLKQFASSFKGNPQQMVQQLLQSGRMSQEQYNQYRQWASQIKNNFNF